MLSVIRKAARRRAALTPERHLGWALRGRSSETDFRADFWRAHRVVRRGHSCCSPSESKSIDVDPRRSPTLSIITPAIDRREFTGASMKASTFSLAAIMIGLFAPNAAAATYDRGSVLLLL